MRKVRKFPLISLVRTCCDTIALATSLAASPVLDAEDIADMEYILKRLRIEGGNLCSELRGRVPSEAWDIDDDDSDDA